MRWARTTFMIYILPDVFPEDISLSHHPDDNGEKGGRPARIVQIKGAGGRSAVGEF